MAPIKHWDHEEIEHLQDCKVFTVGRTMATSPTSGDRHPFYRIDSVDWVNVVAVTPADELVMVRQFRHGSRDVTLEIPGGMVDAGEVPADAGARELLEETGYRGDEIVSIGLVNPNPALFGNTCHTFLIRGCERVAEICNGKTEETAVELVPVARAADKVRTGEITHALVVAGLYWFELWRSQTR